MPTKRYDFLVFDLDGTLADTRDDIADSLNHALVSGGREPLDLATITHFVGDGARVLLERALGAGTAQETVMQGLKCFLERYLATCLNKTRLYPLVAETLQSLAGKELAVLTNKPRQPTERILDGLGLRRHFRWVQCGDDRWPKKPDPAGLLHLVEAAGSSCERTLFVGDSGVDLATARNAGVPAAFVTYGFRPDALAAAPKDGAAPHVLHRFDQLLELNQGPA